MDETVVGGSAVKCITRHGMIWQCAVYIAISR